MMIILSLEFTNIYFLGISSRLNVIYGIDSSNDVTPEMVTLGTRFIVASLKSFNISESQTRVGLVNYGNEANEILGISANPVRLRDSLKYLRRIRGERKPSKAIQIARNMFSASDANDGKEKVLVLFLFGKIAQSDVSRFIDGINEIQKDGVRLIFVTVNVIDGGVIFRSLKNNNDLINTRSVEDLSSALGSVEERIAKLTGNHLECMNSYKPEF